MPSTVTTADPSSAKLPSLTASQRHVAAALAEVHDAKVIDIVALVDVSKSSVAKALTLLERAGAAIRTVREEDGVREADLWSPGPALGSLLFGADCPVAGSDGGDALDEPDEVATVARVGVSDEAVAEDPALPAESAAGLDADVYVDADAADVTGDGGLEPKIAAAQPVASDAATDAAPTAWPEPGGSGADGRPRRLAPGELAGMVTTVLVAHPDIEYTPTMLSHMLEDRSPGAIHNVLEKLVASGAVERTREKPKSYRHVVAEASTPA